MSRYTIGIALLGLGLRLFLIFPGPLESKVEMLSNKADLRNYYWPAQSVARGENPYELWATGQADGYRADMAPLELGLYVGTVAIWNDPRAIQVLFALFDTLNIVLLGVLFKGSSLKMPFQSFYAFGPLTLYNFSLVPEDKTIVLTLTFLLFYLLQETQAGVRLSNLPRSQVQFERSTLVIIVTALIAAFKWLSVFYLLPILIYISSDVRAFIKNAVIFGAIVTLTHVPWFPSWVYVYVFRSARVATPLHVAPAVLLNVGGLYHPWLMLVLLATCLLAVYALFWFQRIDIFETIALATMAGVLWTPDMDPVHLALVVIMLLLIFDWSSQLRLLTVWGWSAFVAAVYLISTHSGFARYGLPQLVGEYGSPRMILLSFSLFFVVFGFYLWGKRQRQVLRLSAISNP